MNRPAIFISYSHKDVKWKDRLVTHLGVLQQQHYLDFWTDDEIGIGEEWFQKIQDAMGSASVAILLVSANFLTSKFILREEVIRLLERREREGLPIFPILLQPCMWEVVPWLADVQIRPRNGKPLSAGNKHKIDENLTAIVKEIKAVLDRVIASAAKKLQPSSVEILAPQQKEENRQVDLERTLQEKAAGSETLAPTLRNSIGMELVLIPTGEFRMGAREGEDNEKPVHLVRISRPFYLGKYPVTQAQWEAVMGKNPSRFTGDPNRPVENISWHDVQEFLRRLNGKEGGVLYGLPTEAEWEYAARAGAETAYCFGNENSQLREYAWYYENSGGTTHSVGQLKPNAWGLYDVQGNVLEWVEDWYDAAYYQRSPVEDPRGPEAGQYRVVRGGSWGNEPRNVRGSFRGRRVPGRRNDHLGFRCAR